MIIVCPHSGPLAVTLRSPLDTSALPSLTAISTVTSEVVPMSSTPLLVPISALVDLLIECERSLRQSHTHPRDATIVGVLKEQLTGLEVILGRVSSRQAEVEERDLSASSEAEARAMRAAIHRLGPLLEQIKRGEATAEDMLSLVRAEPSSSITLDRLRAAVSGVEVVASDGVVLDADPRKALARKFVAARPIEISARVSAVHEDNTADLVFLGVRSPSVMFEATDVDHRQITVTVPDDGAFQLIGHCLACRLQFNVILMPAITLARNGLKYEATVISICDPDLIWSRIRTRLPEQQLLPLDAT